ncbi:LysR family transcriptional regulator [Sphingomonas sp.]|uniref:LysR family transcriptional regulator n=1 Tax=Sphingomonas sp. TaxID=28214 RepID=UPI002B6C1FC4|nr:LysR family transcriptional regulator [Sphingomonas sp.]HWK37130.1 LysR family transcriptional regulator [Sphingomonas sp.]
MTSLNRFDLNLLRIFEAIYAEGGVSGASRKLSLSQPAVSHSLARLREAFDDPLFVRHGNAFVPTAVSRAKIAEVGAILRRIDVALAVGEHFDPLASTRTFRIGLRPPSEAYALPLLFRELQRDAPGVSLASVYFSRTGMPRALAVGALDLAIDIDLATSPGTNLKTLGAAPPVLVARRDHPLIGDTVSLDQYLAVDHVFVSPRAAGLGMEDAALARIGHRRRIRMRCQHAFTAWQLVGESDLVCTLPRYYAAAFEGTGTHRLLPLPFDVPARPLSLYWHDTSAADPGAVWLRRFVAATLGAA